VSLLKNVVNLFGAKTRVEIGDTDRVGHFYLIVHAMTNFMLQLSCSSFTQNNTIMNAHKTPFESFQTLYITMVLQIKHNIVIAMSSNHPTIGEKQ
jgi:hypothetical protein